MNAIARPPLPRLTAIGSGKGGTGKTLIAIHLARALAQAGERVLLCDADLGLSNTTVHLGLKDGGDLPGVVAGDCEIDDVAVAAAGGAGKGGFDLLSAPAGSGAFANVGVAAANALVAKLRAAHQYDRVVLDLGAGVDATTMSIAAAADETIAVLTPDPAALTDAYAFAKLLLRVTRFRAPEFLVNMASDAEARRTAEAFVGTCRAFLKIEPACLGNVPRDNAVLEGVRRQQCLMAGQPASPAMRVLSGVAAVLHGRIAPARAAAGGLR
jgi:flagellar biosynthesis protein FlhG